MARSKQVTDEQIIASAMNCVIEIGPSMTLADVGERVDLSAATVVQRFGTKRDLMREVIKLRVKRVQSVDFTEPGQPVDRVVEGLAGLTSLMRTKEDVANYMACLHTDLADPEFCSMINSQFSRHRVLIAAVLDEAIAEGQLRPCDTTVLARLLELTMLGAQQSWAIEPHGELAQWVEDCLRRCIEPWCVADEDLATSV